MSTNCTTCKAFYPWADGMSVPSFTRGELLPLSDHSCNLATNSTTECCRYDFRTDECGVFFFDSFQHPCALCTGEDRQLPTRSLCTFCTKSYPNEKMIEIDVVNNNTRTEELSQHECAANNNGDTTNCCLYDASTDQCGLFVNDSFAYPCGSCDVPLGNRTISKTTINYLIGGTIGGLIFFLAFCYWKRVYYKNLPNEMSLTIKAPEVPLATLAGCGTGREYICRAQIVSNDKS